MVKIVLLCSVSSDVTVIVFETLNISATGSVAVKVSWTEDPSAISKGNFTYYPNPQLFTNSIPAEVAMFVRSVLLLLLLLIAFM